MKCGEDRFLQVQVEPYGFGALSKPRTVLDPCPGLISDECGPREIALWQNKTDELKRERDDLLAELREAGCVWPQDLEDAMAMTDGYRLRYSDEWGLLGSGLKPLYGSIFGVELEQISATNIVQIHLELIARLTCELERLSLLNVAQDCGADRPDPFEVKKRSWAPWLIGGGILIALVQGFRFGAAIRR